MSDMQNQDVGSQRRWSFLATVAFALTFLTGASYVAIIKVNAWRREQAAIRQIFDGGLWEDKAHLSGVFTPPAPYWLSQLMPDAWQEATLTATKLHVMGNGTFEEIDTSLVQDLPNLQELEFCQVPISDTNVACIIQHQRLGHLRLLNTIIRQDQIRKIIAERPDLDLSVEDSVFR